MQAIQTRFIPCTNTKPDRIKAWCAAGSITVSYPYGLDAEHAHYNTANQLKSKLAWDSPHYGYLECGQLPNGDYAFVMVKP